MDGPDASAGDAFLAPAELRQPAQELGPRAQRTIARIVDATRDVFMTRGYAGTTIDEITKTAEVSRASFYTYFPSKREVLLAVGADAATGFSERVERLAAEGSTRATLRAWVADFLDYLDTHAPFSFAWTQAALEDEEIRVAGMRRHLRICARLGAVLGESAGRAVDKPAEVGLLASSMLERMWSYCQLYGDSIDRNDMIDQAAAALWGLAREQR